MPGSARRVSSVISMFTVAWLPGLFHKMGEVERGE
jgi:hypothetical protein